MKIPPFWQLGIGDTQIMPVSRHRSSSKRPLWIIILVSLVCVSLIGAYIYPQWHHPTCYFFASSVCSSFKDWLPPLPARQLTDEEIAAHVVFRDILSLPPIHSTNPKIAFLFLTPGTLPFERLWEKFFLVDFINQELQNLEIPIVMVRRAHHLRLLARPPTRAHNRQMMLLAITRASRWCYRRDASHVGSLGIK